MSERQDKIVMPQPEQWLSEHPFWMFLFLVALYGGLFLVLWWIS